MSVEIGDLAEQMIKHLHNIEEMERTKGTIEFESEACALFDMISKARKEFPIPNPVLRYKISKGLGLGNVNTFELKKWFEKWFGKVEAEPQ